MNRRVEKVEHLLDDMVRVSIENSGVSFRRLAVSAGLDPKKDFIGASLRNIDFRDEDLVDFNFTNADLKGSDFRRAKLAGTKFDNADLFDVIGLDDLQSRQGNCERPFDAQEAKSRIVSNAALEQSWKMQLRTLRLGKSGATSLKGLMGAENLESLSIMNTSITDLEPIRFLSKIRNLWLDNSRVKDLEPISGLKNLSTLEINGCRELTSIDELSNLTRLYRLSLKRTAVENIDVVSKFAYLRYLMIDRTKVKDIEPIKDLKELYYLSAMGLNIADSSPLSNNLNLRYLYFSDAGGDLSWLANLTLLAYASIGSASAQEIPRLNNLQSLINITFNLPKVKDLSQIAHCKSLRQIALYNVPSVDLKVFEGLSKLKNIAILNSTVVDLAAIRGMKQVDTLRVDGCQDFDILSILDSDVQNLSMSRCSNINSYEVARLKSVRYLNITGSDIIDIDPLLQMPELRTIQVSNVHFKIKRDGVWIDQSSL